MVQFLVDVQETPFDEARGQVTSEKNRAYVKRECFRLIYIVIAACYKTNPKNIGGLNL
jgi:hypothetical protein